VINIDPKVLILVVVICAAIIIAVLAIMHIIERIKQSDTGKFKCVHCKGKHPPSEKDNHFEMGICKTCGEFLIPTSSRKGRSN